MVDERERGESRLDSGENSRYDGVYSQAIKAGKRTYFFDVKSTRSDDFYITITESKKRAEMDHFVYEKHKIFLYKEDFEKFAEGLSSAIAFINEKQSTSIESDRKKTIYSDANKEESFTDFSFDDL